jgi:hypothetical protein
MVLDAQTLEDPAEGWRFYFTTYNELISYHNVTKPKRRAFEYSEALLFYLIKKIEGNCLFISAEGCRNFFLCSHYKQ